MAIYYENAGNSIDGRVIQVKEFRTNNQSNHTSTSYTDTNLTINITPTASDTNILVMAFWTGGIFHTSYNSTGSCGLYRDSSIISERHWFADNGQGSAVQVNITTNESICALDVGHNTTSQITYKMKVKQGQSNYSPTYKFGHNTAGGSASKQTIVVMEIAD
tara:strand:- start:252 stop:737 length:486 start_codon:yes stop_codon:yes gene_type:complete